MRCLLTFKCNCLSIVVFIFTFGTTLATTIVPPANLAELFNQTEFVVYGEVVSHADKFGMINNFSVLESYKGGIEVRSNIRLKEFSSHTPSSWSNTRGDVNFIIGEKYLLFLFKDKYGFYRPRMLALSVFQEVIKNDVSMLVRTEKVLDLCFLDVVDPSLLGSYTSSQLREQLKTGIVETKKAGFEAFEYNSPQVGVHAKKSSSCTIPFHCTTLVGDPGMLGPTCNLGGTPSPAKYPANTHFLIKIASGADDDLSTSMEINYLTDAINTLDNLDGISMSLASPMVQNCNTTGCSQVAALTNNICNPTDANEIWIYFDDPCDELTDLSPNCGGTLGKGGTFGTTPCLTDQCGNQWVAAKSSYVFLNSGIGCLSGYDYTALIMHELLHGLNINHISGTCTALMNGGLCQMNAGNNLPNFGLTSLDIECIEWMYYQCRDQEDLVDTTFQNGVNGEYFVVNEITSTDVLVSTNADVHFQAGSYIQIDSEFEVESGAVFHALINGCTL